MRPITREWIEKAEGDFATTERECRARKSPNYDAACFHAQQCAEKYLKAILEENQLAFVKTHDLLDLLESVLPIHPEWENFREDLAFLTAFGVEVRYPGESANREAALDARRRCRRFRAAARLALGIASREEGSPD